ncbi:hypothetical protein GGR57DRAFT_39115 [Xylariaceae sp. FL1272]|nr:hypothetical protein GGR57DRAFT_39115 [Xylariaceae sp. FL1272]
MPGVVAPEPEPELLDDADPDSLPVELPLDDTPPRPYVVLHQHVELEIDFREKRVYGRSHILVAPIAEDVTTIHIDARQCSIDLDNVTVSNCPARATYHDPCDLFAIPESYIWSAGQWAQRQKRVTPLLHHRRDEVPVIAHDMACCQPLDGALQVTLPSPEEVKAKNANASRADQQELLIQADGNVTGYRVSIPFELKNVNNGLHFVGVDEGDTRYPHVYTRHSVEPGTACSIFPCIDDPGCRNFWKVSITTPRTLGDALHQPLATQQHFKKVAANGSASRKRKFGQEEPKPPAPYREFGLTEEDKLLEMTVVCSGFLTGETAHKTDESKKIMTFEVDKNKAAKHIGFAVGPFEHVDLWSEFRSEEDDQKLGVSAAKVHGYCLPGRAEEVRSTCAAIVTAVDHFVLQFGRYPFDNYKVCFVDDMVESTIPLCAFSLCSSRLLCPADIIDYEIETTRTLVYALASQWFGVNVVPNTSADIWVVAGVAWFMTDHFMKYAEGNNAFRFRMKTMADRLVDIDVKRPSLQDLGSHLYLGSFEVDFMNLKAPLVLFILDRRLSKSSGSTGISRIISRMVSKANTSTQANDDVLSSDAFRKACEKLGSTRLETFWQQWVVGSGCPRFLVHQRFNKKKLCVEMTIQQTQDIHANKKRQINVDEFWKEVREETHSVWAGPLQSCFTGPMTIRIHEADGTPYEHIVELREDAAKSVRFEIPYNTKYKRLKRNRRQRERAMANNHAKEEGQKELYYLGDVMQQPHEIEEWDFRDWDEESENKMDQESYEWIRMDADFEWICEMKSNLPAYMYASQLQQDRDVAAQQDSMLFLQQSSARSGAHPLMATILTRTLLDVRYFYGLRLMAVDDLPTHAVLEQVDWIGFRHLRKVFQHFFCHPGTNIPKPNDFTNMRQYAIQRAIPEAVARIRGEDGKCPKEARRFILEVLQGNNNEDNAYSDQPYICRLIKALAVCQIPDKEKEKPPMTMSLSFGDNDDDDVVGEEIDPEPEEFQRQALEEINIYRRKDEYAPSFQNCFTVASLDALCQLMKAKVIPVNPKEFAQYLQDRTCDVVRIKACDSLVELELLEDTKFLQFFLSLASTDPSPFVRDQLFKVLCRGLARMATGESPDPSKEAPQLVKDDLVVDQEALIMAERQRARERKTDLKVALAALKTRTEYNEELQEALWQALDSPALTVAERIKFLELCALVVDANDSMIVKFKYPTAWRAQVVESVRGKTCKVRFTRRVRTKPRKAYTPPVPPAPPKPQLIKLKSAAPLGNKLAPALPSELPPPPEPTLSQKKNSISVTLPKSTSGTTQPIVKTPKPPVAKASPKPSVAKPPVVTKSGAPSTPTTSTASFQDKGLSKGEQRRDSIAVLPPIRPTIEVSQSEQKTNTAKAPKVNGNIHLATKNSKSLKRASTESEYQRPSKIVKLNTGPILNAMKQLEAGTSRPSTNGPESKRMLLTLKFDQFDKIQPRERGEGSTIRAAGKKATLDEKPDPNSGHLEVPETPHFSPSKFDALKATPPPKSASQPKASTPTSTSQSATNPPSSGSGGGKPRKPLPDMTRRPLPSAGHNQHPTPSKASASASPPASAPPPVQKPKLKLKLKKPS